MFNLTDFFKKGFAPFWSCKTLKGTIDLGHWSVYWLLVWQLCHKTKCYIIQRTIFILGWRVSAKPSSMLKTLEMIYLYLVLVCHQDCNSVYKYNMGHVAQGPDELKPVYWGSVQAKWRLAGPCRLQVQSRNEFSNAEFCNQRNSAFVLKQPS